jgi:hypothetical protein
MLQSHRHQMWRLVPWWLRGFYAFRILYAIAVVVDALGDALLAAVKIRFPNLYSTESLSPLGAERRKRRGRNESPESFAARLDAWWDTAKHSGDFCTIAKELAAYYLPTRVKIEIVSNNGTRYTLGTDGSWVIDSVSWTWDSHSEYWSRFWVLIANDAIQATSTSRVVLDPSENVLQDTRFVGSDATDTAADLRAILEDNRPPHTHCEHIMVLLDYTEFWASPPSGNWDRWANRSQQALYWGGTPTS